MSKILKKKISTFLVIVLSFIMIVIPATAGFAAAKIVKSNTPLEYSEIEDATVKETLIQEALGNEDVKLLITKLTDGNYKVADSRVAKLEYNKTVGSFVFLKLTGSKEVQLVYSKFGNKIKVGAGVYQTVNGTTQIEVYDISNGKIFNTSAINIIDNIPQVTWKDGPLLPTNKEAINEKNDVVSASWSNCEICNTVCAAIYSSGCGVTSFILCTAACLPIGTFFCPIICGVVFSLICSELGSGYTCPYICNDAGYCP